MSKLPSVSGDRLVRALKRSGFVELRQKGSHLSLERKSEDKIYKIVVPMHKTLAKGTLSDILKQAGLTVEQLLELL
jgi:predicted RNA binding protein YcfA (HicA-like mRNA interferase family)